MNVGGKVALVTGASKGIGKEVTRALCREGARVAISARSGNLLDNLAHELRPGGADVWPFAGDMSKEKEIHEFVRGAANHFGSIDIVVNNSGVGYFAPVGELTLEQWDGMFDLNVRSVFILTREALPHLRKAGESAVVNVVSLAGKNAFVGGAGYAASKHAVLAFSRCLMLEERKNGMRVLAICPGSVDTNFFDGREERSHPNLIQALKPADVASTIIHMLRMPQRAMISEVDIRPSNPA